MQTAEAQQIQLAIFTKCKNPETCGKWGQADLKTTGQLEKCTTIENFTKQTKPSVDSLGNERAREPKS